MKTTAKWMMAEPTRGSSSILITFGYITAFPSSLRPCVLASHASRSSHVPSATSAMSPGAPSSLVVTPGLCRPNTSAAKLRVALLFRWWRVLLLEEVVVGECDAPGDGRWWLCPRRWPLGAARRAGGVSAGYWSAGRGSLSPRWETGMREFSQDVE